MFNDKVNLFLMNLTLGVLLTRQTFLWTVVDILHLHVVYTQSCIPLAFFWSLGL